jgi:hypothetical protein
VAAAGIDQEAGLTGYRDSPRTEKNQHIANIQGLGVVASSPPLDLILQNSKWNTRAWTFPEGQFARRALIFTNEQVYYVCSSTSSSEDIALETVRPHTRIGLIMEQCHASTLRHYLPGRYSALTVNSAWEDYQQMVESYSPRELTHESDVLRAVLGYLNNLQLLHDALFWVPVNGEGYRLTSDIRPTRIYLTWSWAGWNGAVQYHVLPASEKCLIDEWRVVSIEDLLKNLEGDVLTIPPLEAQNDGCVTFLPNLRDATGEEQRKVARTPGSWFRTPYSSVASVFKLQW